MQFLSTRVYTLREKEKEHRFIPYKLFSGGRGITRSVKLARRIVSLANRKPSISTLLTKVARRPLQRDSIGRLHSHAYTYTYGKRYW